MKAIVYTSNTGYTARYAALLGERTGLPVCELPQAKERLGRGDAVLYLGWLRAGGITGLKQARRLWDVRAVCAVGMAEPDPKMEEKLARENRLGGIPLFYLRGGYDGAALRGINRMMMSFMEKSLEMASQREHETEAREMLEAVKHGGNWVSPERLSPVLAWLEGAV